MSNRLLRGVIRGLLRGESKMSSLSVLVRCILLLCFGSVTTRSLLVKRFVAGELARLLLLLALLVLLVLLVLVLAFGVNNVVEDSIFALVFDLVVICLVL